MPTASMATSTPAPPVRALTWEAAAAPGGAHGVRGPEPPGHLEPVRVGVDHHHGGGRVELRGEQRGQADGPRAHDRHGVARLHLAVQHPALEPGGEDVAQEHAGLLVGVFGQGVEARVRVGNAHVLRLGPVDAVAEDPAAVPAVGVHPLAAEVAAPAGADAGDEDLVSLGEAVHRGPHFLDAAHGLVAEDPSLFHGGHVALQDVQVGPADRGGRDPHESIGGLEDAGFRLVFPGALSRSVVDERLHGGRRRLRRPCLGIGCDSGHANLLWVLRRLLHTPCHRNLYMGSGEGGPLRRACGTACGAAQAFLAP